nr:HD domain-containing phosphohydrolase [Oceanicoccus sagamiensis]
MTINTSRKYPLHIHISTLLVTMIILLGGSLVWLSYNQSTQLISSASNQLFEDLAQDSLDQFNNHFEPVSSALHVLAANDYSGPTFDTGLNYSPLLASLLKRYPQTTTLQIGWPNGDYFVMRYLNSDYKKQLFNPPPGAAFIADHIRHSETGAHPQTRVFFDKEMTILDQLDFGTSDYDPRKRSWFKEAPRNQGNYLSEPYLFYFLKQPGLTSARKAVQSDAVIAADISLIALSNALKQTFISPSAITAISNDKGEILAYNQSSKLTLGSHKDDSLHIIKLSELNHSAIDSFLGDTQAQQSEFFQVGEETWISAEHTLFIRDDLNLNLTILAPVSELFSDAYQMRDRNLLITLALVLITLPIAWFMSNQISKSIKNLAKQARAISRFDFSSKEPVESFVLEVDQLSRSMDRMQFTISRFINLINSLAGEEDLGQLLDKISAETMTACGAQAATIYLLSDDETTLQAQVMHFASGEAVAASDLASFTLNSETSEHPIVKNFSNQETALATLHKDHYDGSTPDALFEQLNTDDVMMLLLPLHDRDHEKVGVICLFYPEPKGNKKPMTAQQQGFAEALSGFAAVSVESRQLQLAQKNLLQAFIELIASAIDAKSPYTGGHCQRVPELTKMLARAGCQDQGHFKDFNLSTDEWEELHIAGWLHDCGKVTTPEYVVDKATKLETIYNRIHEIRMRFEVLKRDAEIDYWQQVANNGDQAALSTQLQEKLQQLDSDFAFIAECNEGGEFISEDKLARLQALSQLSWKRTLSDTIGLSWEELQRHNTTEQSLPVAEKLLADKPEHIIERKPSEVIPENNPWGFKLNTPEHKYNRGELYNLSIARGTLAEEERFKINDHMVQTIIMLKQLPYPKHLRNVPTIAGGHHETMIGTGYPDDSPKTICR